MIKFFFWKLFELIRDRCENPISIQGFDERIVLNQLPLLKDKIGFFITSPYPRVLSEKNLIIPEANR